MTREFASSSTHSVACSTLSYETTVPILSFSFFFPGVLTMLFLFSFILRIFCRVFLYFHDLSHQYLTFDFESPSLINIILKGLSALWSLLGCTNEAISQVKPNVHWKFTTDAFYSGGFFLHQGKG